MFDTAGDGGLELCVPNLEPVGAAIGQDSRPDVFRLACRAANPAIELPHRNRIRQRGTAVLVSSRHFPLIMGNTGEQERHSTPEFFEGAWLKN